MMMTSSDVCGAKDLILSRFQDLDKLSPAGMGLVREEAHAGFGLSINNSL